LLRELPNGTIRVSMRSKTNLDIGKLIRKLGGGGHSKAAGATLKTSITEAKKKILELVTEELSLQQQSV
jgi:phosphoesterase RecJ-like protein